MPMIPSTPSPPPVSRWPTVIGVGLAAVFVVIVVISAYVRRPATPNAPAQKPAAAAPETRPSGTLAVTAAPGKADWQTFQVTDANDPNLAYAFDVPPGHRAAFREFGYDVEVTDAKGQTMLTISRYRGQDGSLAISVAGYTIVEEQPFTRGQFPGKFFILKTPPEKFNPVLPVWWLNRARQEVHVPVPSLQWVVVFSAAPEIPREVFATFASSLRLPPR